MNIPVVSGETIACLSEMLEYPTWYTQRCVEQVGFLAEGGQTWIRTVQVQVPELALSGARWRVVSLGMFRRRRFPDFVVHDSVGARVNLLTRQQHGEVLARAIVAKYLRQSETDLKVLDKSEPARRAYEKLILGAYGLLTTAGDRSDPEMDAREISRSYDVLLVALGTTDVEQRKALVGAIASDFVQLLSVTQYLCWVRAAPGQVVNLRASYTVSDARRGLTPSTGTSSNAAGRRMRLYRKLGLAPLNYALHVPSHDHAGSYYFTISPPENTEITYVNWGVGDTLTGESEEVDCAMTSVHLHTGRTASSDADEAGQLEEPEGGGTIAVFLRNTTRDHKKIAAGALLNLLFVFLVAAGRASDKIGSSAQTWLLVTPTALTAYIAEQQRHYYANATRRQRGILWGYLLISLSFLIASSFSLANGSTAGRDWGWVARDSAWLLAVSSAVLVAWYVPLGVSYHRNTARLAERFRSTSKASRLSYERAVLRYSDVIATVGILVAIGAGVGTPLYWRRITELPADNTPAATIRPASSSWPTVEYVVEGTCAIAHCRLQVRSRASAVASQRIGDLSEGSTVRISCQSTGPAVARTSTSKRASRLWDRLAADGWVSDVYLRRAPGPNDAFRILPCLDLAP